MVQAVVWGWEVTVGEVSAAMNGLDPRMEVFLVFNEARDSRAIMGFERASVAQVVFTGGEDPNDAFVMFEGYGEGHLYDAADDSEVSP